MNSTGRHAATIHRVGDQPPPRCIEGAVFAQRSIRQQRIEPAAITLSLARDEDPFSYGSGRFAG